MPSQVLAAQKAEFRTKEAGEDVCVSPSSYTVPLPPRTYNATKLLEDIAEATGQ